MLACGRRHRQRLRAWLRPMNGAPKKMGLLSHSPRNLITYRCEHYIREWKRQRVALEQNVTIHICGKNNRSLEPN